MTYEILPQDGDNALNKAATEDNTGLTELLDAFIDAGIDKSFLAKHTLDIIKNATVVNNEGIEHPDYETRRKAIKMVVDMHDKRPKNQINFMNIIQGGRL